MAQELINKQFHVIALQKKTYAEPRQNIAAVKSLLDSYDGPEADFVMLPEIFTCPYDNNCFPQFAESGIIEAITENIEYMRLDDAGEEA